MRVDKLPAIVVDDDTFFEKIVRPSMDGDGEPINIDKYDIAAVSPHRGDDEWSQIIIFNDFDGRERLIKFLDDQGVLILARDTAVLVLFEKRFGKEMPVFCGFQEDERMFMGRVEKYRRMKEGF